MDFDPKLRVFTLAKPLMAGLAYPYDWGFIPSTKAEDGDPLDVLVIHDAQTYPGVVLRCKPIGILEVEQTSKGSKERNDRVFAVPKRSPLEANLKDVRHLPARAREELEQFFLATNALEDKKLKFLGWRGPAESYQENQDSCSISKTQCASRYARQVPHIVQPRKRSSSRQYHAIQGPIAGAHAAQDCPGDVTSRLVGPKLFVGEAMADLLQCHVHPCQSNAINLFNNHDEAST